MVAFFEIVMLGRLKKAVRNVISLGGASIGVPSVQYFEKELLALLDGIFRHMVHDLRAKRETQPIRNILKLKTQGMKLEVVASYFLNLSSRNAVETRLV